MQRTYRLTQARLRAAREYVASVIISHTHTGQPMLAKRYETPHHVERTLTRIYGTPRVPRDSETAYWEIDDGGKALGLEIR
jgi:hypothetical protein